MTNFFRYMLLCFLAFLMQGFFLQLYAQKSLVVVDISGKGDFTSIQQAINSLSDTATSPRKILIKKGIYNEKLFIEKHNIILEGEQVSEVIISQAIAREIWRCSNPDDWGVATVNLKGNDISLINLTILNNYGTINKTATSITCINDSSGEKKIRPDGHQMALRSFQTTRLKVINCVLRAFGGDTVSPWNVSEGMFYFKDCIMEGGVDFYCPRGWAYAENCTFIANTGTASIWHDGSVNKDAKTVLRNCKFSGFDGFMLGRYHRDAQFYLLDCRFASNMADKDIYLVPTNNIIKWGRRIYYYNCHRENGSDYKWFADNLSEAEGNPSAEKINAMWTFKNKWNPLKDNY